MSIIVAVTKRKRTVVACDTVCFCGGQRESPDNVVQCKVRQVGSSLIGSSGWMLYDNLFDHYLRRRRPPAFTNEHAIFDFFIKLWKALRKDYTLVNEQPDKGSEGPFGDLAADFLIGNRQGIFGVDSNLTVLRFKRYYAIGSGAPYAFGALEILYDSQDDPAEIARRAVDTAVHFDERCGGQAEVFPVQVRANRRRPA
ncbi:MAG: hypothetical protein ACYSVY_15395 [Planctomycetota bacterium]|jgi:ATP-dependent protease HslVU (ClpYQ) peptidase subunit